MNIQNTELKTAIKDAISGNTLEGLPNQLMDKVTAVIDVNPAYPRTINRIFTSSTTASGSVVIINGDPNRDIFLHGVEVALFKDVVCDIASGFVSINVQVNKSGSTTFVCTIPVITTTAESHHKSVLFPVPIKIDRNTAITSTAAAHGAGVLSRRTTIYYTLVDNF